MIAEIPPDRIPTYAAAFPGPHLALVMASVAAGNTAAQLWKASNAGEPALLLLWDKGNSVFYLSADRISAATQHELAAFIASELRERALRERSAYFKVRALAPAIESTLETLFGAGALQQLPSLLYRFDRAAPPPMDMPQLDGIRFAQIDQPLLADDKLGNIAHVRGEIQWMWPSLGRFFEQGLGCTAIVERQVVCWCTAEYLSADRCGIGIETVEAYQGQGVATATAAEFVRLCMSRGITPFWECRANNIGSLRVAEKVGFTLLEEETYWVGRFDAGIR